ncbi:glucuronyl hydrolase [Tessaracoccus rhinocerotis]|uniref:Glucuronyl hydrolase n=1 Tax=Tessaracoccus rhinocerotis TaxID=1689449 RepID=A0A553JZL3_9ACTN|nr:glycoside hydrolase family 88 protein [Tessaracoccus rhinocerotis]TRY17891.1 glucuronyl hydrolase [Tessaracoccus rhinocerotis]
MSTMPRAATSTDKALDAAVAIAHSHLKRFADVYPEDTTIDGVYPLRRAQYGQPEGGNTEWTTGFLPGMLWALGEASGDEALLDGAQAHVPSFVERITGRIDIATHDLGFLYTLSCVTAWRERGDEVARDAALLAADHLMTRFLDSAGIIQAWGDLADPAQRGRTIIDSLMNLPLLYWATETTGDARYRDAAVRHTRALRDNIVRADDTTHHTFHWDPETGEPLRGSTAQGYGDDSCWARGQAWGIYGFTLGYRHTGDETLLELAGRLADYFLAHLPADRVPYWDLMFTDADGQERDSSAAAISVCGLLELAAATGRADYGQAAEEILESLATDYATDGTGPRDCLLLHSVYDKNGGKGVDEGNLWGDYFYAEALLRRTRPEWVSYWHPLEGKESR